jgi:ketosteroid isomerase-like protein
MATSRMLILIGRGLTTGLKYDMVYCWIIRFNKERKIDRVRAYLDTDLLTRAIGENR